MLNQPLLDTSDNEPHNTGRATGKEQINPSPTNSKTQGETHDKYVQENPPETKIASKAAIKHVKKNPPDTIHRKSTQLEETKARNLECPRKATERIHLKARYMVQKTIKHSFMN